MELIQLLIVAFVFAALITSIIANTEWSKILGIICSSILLLIIVLLICSEKKPQTIDKHSYYSIGVIKNEGTHQLDTIYKRY